MHAIFLVAPQQVRPGLIAAFIFNLILVWNEFLSDLVIGGVEARSNVRVVRSGGPECEGGDGR